MGNHSLNRDSLFMIKVLCLGLFGVSVFGVIRGMRILRFGASGSTLGHIGGRIFVSVALAIFWAWALYAVQMRKTIIWPVGWVVMIGGYAIAAIEMGRAILTAGGQTDRLIEFGTAEAAAAAIVGFWCFRWNSLKDHFVTRAKTQP